MTPHGIGIIGYGGFGRFLHRAWDQMDAVEVRAVADITDRDTPDGVVFYDDWRALLSDEGVQIISVATPPFLHAEMACAALEAGKHVLVEKPVGLTSEEAERIERVARESGCIISVDYMLRFNPIVEVLHAWCRSGAFGRLQRVVVENYAQDDALPPEHWFWNAERSGGILVEHAVHFIDVVNGCTAASVDQVSGWASYRNPGRQDRVMATVTYEDGLLATHYHAFSRPGFFEHTSMRFVFDLAQVEVEGWIPLSGRFSALMQPNAEPSLQELPGLDVAIRPVDDVPDRSRPDGWGADGGAQRQSVHSAGRAYEVQALAKGTFALPTSKSRAYAGALRALLADVVRRIDRPDHDLRVSLADGIASLDVALRAREDALRHAGPHRQHREAGALN